jgi:hypothetical protein
MLLRIYITVSLVLLLVTGLLLWYHYGYEVYMAWLILAALCF